MTDFATIDRRFKALTRRMGGQMTNNAVTGMMSSIAANSNKKIPVATSKLINSRFQRVSGTIGRTLGVVGYAAPYAAAVHNARGVLIGTNTPRSPASLGNVWDPNAEPKFMNKGAQATLRNSAQSILRRSYSI